MSTIIKSKLKKKKKKHAKNQRECKGPEIGLKVGIKCLL